MSSIAKLTTEIKDQLDARSYWVDEAGDDVTSYDYIQKIYGILGLTIPVGMEASILNLSQSSDFKIYNYIDGDIDPTIHPKDIIFPEQVDHSLPKQTIIEDGERTETIYYGSYDVATSTYQDEVIKIKYTFHRAASGYATHRDREICWALEDGTYHSQTKIHTHYYTTLYDQQSELTARRRNIVTETKSLAEMMGLRFAIGNLFATYSDEIARYESAGSGDFAAALLADTTYTWLDGATLDPNIDIRTFLHAKFIIGLLT